MKEQTKKQFGSVFIWITAIIYVLLGILFMVNPAGMASGLGYENLNKNALTDVMATYGGLELGIGVVLIMFLRERNLSIALKVIFLTFAGFALGRSIAAIRFGGFYGDHCFWLVFELVYILITIYYIRKNKTTSEDSSCV
jgi:hypothetical protein